MGDGPRQHRLSHRGGAALLQRAVRAGAPAGGGASYWGDAGSPPWRSACHFACSVLSAGEGDYVDRAHAQVSSEIRGAHAVAPDRRCRADRTLHGATGRSDPGGQAPSRTGISILPGDLTPGEDLSGGAYGSSSPTLSESSRLQLPEYGLHSEEPTRPAAAAWRSAGAAGCEPREHTRRRLLRFPTGSRASGDSVSPQGEPCSTNKRSRNYTPCGCAAWPMLLPNNRKSHRPRN